MNLLSPQDFKELFESNNSTQEHNATYDIDADIWSYVDRRSKNIVTKQINTTSYVASMLRTKDFVIIKKSGEPDLKIDAKWLSTMINIHGSIYANYDRLTPYNKN